VKLSMSPIRVLIVEDDDDIRETLIEVLEDNGFEPSSAANGAEALELLRTGSAFPNVILLDMMMPVLDGWGFRSAQLADPRLSDIPVIVLTAHASIEETARTLGATGFLRKPVRLDPLLDAIRRHAAAERATAD
jgi:two-component system, chemotaxis family, chemotaxis protein CheY